MVEMSPAAAETILEEIEAAFYDIPFENSAFQTRAFVVAGQLTPARAYRTLGLGMVGKIRAVQAGILADKRRALRTERIRSKIAKAKPGGYKQQMLQIDLQEIEQGVSWGKKLLNDALSDLQVMYTEFKKLPKYTRETFEAEEAAHFEQKLSRDVKGIQGASGALANMKADLPNWDTMVKLAKTELEKHNLLGG